MESRISFKPVYVSIYQENQINWLFQSSSELRNFEEIFQFFKRAITPVDVRLSIDLEKFKLTGFSNPPQKSLAVLRNFAEMFQFILNVLFFQFSPVPKLVRSPVVYDIDKKEKVKVSFTFSVNLFFNQ